MKKLVFVKVDGYMPEFKWTYSKEFVDNPELKKLLSKGWRIKKIKKVAFDNQKEKYLIQIYLVSSNQTETNPLFLNNKISEN